MYAYANQYNCKNVMLLYPWHRGIDSLSWEYTIEPPVSAEHNPERKIWIQTIDLSSPKHLYRHMGEGISRFFEDESCLQAAS